MKIRDGTCKINHLSFRQFNEIPRLFSVLALAVVLSFSGEAQIVPGPVGLLNVNGTSDLGYDLDAHVTTDGWGNWVAVWQSNENLNGTAGTDMDIFVATSVDNGVTWTTPALLNTNGNADSEDDDAPKVTTDGAGNWVVVWWSRENLDGTAGPDYDVFVATSTNNGVTWSPPALLNTNGTSDSGHDDSPQVTTDGAGNWVAVWTSSDTLGGTAGTDPDIFVATSTNNGVTWTSPSLLNTNGILDSGNDNLSQITTDGWGNWVAVWQSNENLNGTAGPDQDIFVATSADNGRTWTTTTLLNTNGISDSGIDNRAQVTTDGIGTWVAVWDSREDLNGTAGSMEADVFIATSIDNGMMWTPPALLNTNGNSDSTSDQYPRISTDSTGNWVAVWHSMESLDGAAGMDHDILVATSTDEGVTWTAPAVLNTNGTSDFGDDYRARPATDGKGNWVVVWHSNENLNGSAGTEGDVFVMTFTLATFDTPGDKGSSGSGSCFIATAAFGTALAEEVDTLRAVRDTYMLNNSLGAAFVDSYYRVSPTIADSIAKSEGSRAIVRLFLLPMIAMSSSALAPLYPLAALALILASAGRWVVMKRKGTH